jgi:hypothetical protein
MMVQKAWRAISLPTILAFKGVDFGMNSGMFHQFKIGREPFGTCGTHMFPFPKIRIHTVKP